MENQYKTNGDGNFTPNTDSRSDNQNNNDSTQEKQPPKPVSSRKLHANRENAKKSTGPKTPQGKRRSSFNALKHGLLARKVMFAPDGKLIDENLKRLFESLHDRYSTGDLADELLIELTSMDYWRLQKALEFELKRDYQFNPNLLRYVSANRRALDKSLQRLSQLPAKNDDEEAKAQTMDGDPDSLETDASAARHHDDGTPSGPAGEALQEFTQTGDLEEGSEIEEGGIAKYPVTPVDGEVGGEEDPQARISM